jgi:cell division protein FtsI (penicillin-binding protein 3)
MTDKQGPRVEFWTAGADGVSRRTVAAPAEVAESAASAASQRSGVGGRGRADGKAGNAAKAGSTKTVGAVASARSASKARPDGKARSARTASAAAKVRSVSRTGAARTASATNKARSASKAGATALGSGWRSLRAFAGRASRYEVPAAQPRRRIVNLMVVVAMVFSFEAVQAVNIQSIDADRILTDYYQRQGGSDVRRPTLTALRGSIKDRNGELLAYDEETFTIVVDPSMIAANGVEDDGHAPNPSGMKPEDVAAAKTLPTRIAELLAAYVGGDAAEYRAAMEDYQPKSLRYLELVRNVPKHTYRQFANAVDAINREHTRAAEEKKKGNPEYANLNTRERLLGVTATKSTLRRYPGQTLAASILGYVQVDEKDGSLRGAGLEYGRHEALKGTDGYEEFEGTNSKRIPLGRTASSQPVNGLDHTLTIDSGLQSEVEQILADRVTEARAKSGVALVMDVNSGELLAMASYPTFDPSNWTNAEPGDVAAKEERAKTDPNALNNPALTLTYTPGSVQKVLTFAALLDSGTVKPKDVVTVPSQVMSGADPIRDAWGHGEIELYAQGVLAKSSNIGTILLARKMDTDKLMDYYRSFGLGEKTGLGLPGEDAGIFPAEGSEVEGYSRDGIAFGGSAFLVTPVQEATAIAAVVNGGTYHQPTVLKSTTAANGVTEEFAVAESRRVISDKASRQVVNMMEAMAANSTSHTFDVPGYRVGAKTGTWKKPSGAIVASTVGVAPVEDPQYLVYVVVDEPKTGGSGQSVAGPAERDIMSLVLPRYGVPPSKKKTPKYPVAPAEKKSRQ